MLANWLKTMLASRRTAPMIADLQKRRRGRGRSKGRRGSVSARETSGPAGLGRSGVEGKALPRGVAARG